MHFFECAVLDVYKRQQEDIICNTKDRNSVKQDDDSLQKVTTFSTSFLKMWSAGTS